MTRSGHRQGFISLHRAILDWEWYGDANTCRLFIHLLLTAQFQDLKIRGRTVRRGQRVCSIKKLSEEIGLSAQQTRTALDHLKSTGEVTSQSSPQGTVITVKNYGRYQDITNQITDNQQTTNKRSNKRLTNEQQTTSNNVNKIPPISPKGEMGVFEIYAGEDHRLLDALRAFDQMRTKIKRPMTDVARKRLTQKLDKLAAGYAGLDKADVLEEAVLHCWQSVYPPKNEKTEEDEDEGIV